MRFSFSLLVVILLALVGCSVSGSSPAEGTAAPSVADASSGTESVGTIHSHTVDRVPASEVGIMGRSWEFAITPDLQVAVTVLHYQQGQLLRERSCRYLLVRRDAGRVGIGLQVLDKGKLRPEQRGRYDVTVSLGMVTIPYPVDLTALGADGPRSLSVGGHNEHRPLELGKQHELASCDILDGPMVGHPEKGVGYSVQVFAGLQPLSDAARAELYPASGAEGPLQGAVGLTLTDEMLAELGRPVD